MIVSTKENKNIGTFLQKLVLPGRGSHKGQNGKALIIGGSSLFHGAVIWSAEVVDHLLDMVHVASTKENNDIISQIKTKWQGGIVVDFEDILLYAQEDDVILVGNGMMRGDRKEKVKEITWNEVLAIKDEGEFTRNLVYYLIVHFPKKQFVFDAGALQMMEPEWLLLLERRPILTPHQKEFFTLFDRNISPLQQNQKREAAEEMAKKYNCIILLKAVEDIVTDGTKTVIIEGGNAGLTKGGTGDVLAGLTAGLSTMTDVFSAPVLASFILKKTADELSAIKGYWFSTVDIINEFPHVFHSLVLSNNSGSL